jgi:signal transduction histidine kinase
VLATAGLLARRAANRQRIRPLIGLLVPIAGVAAGALIVHSELLVLGALCVTAVALAHAAPVALAVAYTSIACLLLRPWTDAGTWESLSVLAAGSALGGYLSRQAREGRAARLESAVLTERTRIARELHDVLASSLSAQVVRLEVVRMMLERAGDHDEVLRHVEAAQSMADRGLAEARDAVLALRDDGLPALEALAAEHDAAYTEHGAAYPLAPGVALAIRRVAAEALTNVRKHATGGVTAVHLEYTVDGVRLTVTNEEAERGELSETGAGYGIQGMRERAATIGGTLDAGPADGGFRVTLTVPIGRSS